MKKQVKNYTVMMMSNALGVSCSGYYKWIKCERANKSRYELIDQQITQCFTRSFNTYGSPRIAQDLTEKGFNYSKTTIARRMKTLSLIARPRRKYVLTTDSEHGYRVAENLLNREFEVMTINTVWVSDITYVRVASSWMYLTTFIDLADRMVVGWSLSKNMTAENTVNKAFNEAIANRGITTKSCLMIHSDRGVQYASNEFRRLIRKYGCIQSMSRKGNCWDNAVAESFFKTIKVEALNRYNFTEARTLNKIIFRYINGFYNTVRIHSSLGGLSPLKASQLKLKQQAA